MRRAGRRPGARDAQRDGEEARTRGQRQPVRVAVAPDRHHVRCERHQAGREDGGPPAPREERVGNRSTGQHAQGHAQRAQRSGAPSVALARTRPPRRAMRAAPRAGGSAGGGSRPTRHRADRWWDGARHRAARARRSDRRPARRCRRWATDPPRGPRCTRGGPARPLRRGQACWQPRWCSRRGPAPPEPGRPTPPRGAARRRRRSRSARTARHRAIAWPSTLRVEGCADDRHRRAGSRGGGPLSRPGGRLVRRPGGGRRHALGPRAPPAGSPAHLAGRGLHGGGDQRSRRHVAGVGRDDGPLLRR